MTTIDFLVRRDQLSRTCLREIPGRALDSGQVRLLVEKFALTANNITYAAFGESMNYWNFFPAEEGWGRIPIWGFGNVIESRHPEVAVGEKFYGYYPMSTEIILQPVRASADGFTDGAEHRAALHGVYNAYLRCARDPFHTKQTEDVQALLRPLFMTSWLIDDFLVDNDFFGAAGPGVILLSSASSKTAYGTAFLLAHRKDIEVIGLTSSANLDFCRSLGCYHRIFAYDQLDQVSAESAVVYVDFAGNADLRKTIHARFPNLKYSCSVGGTHVGQLGSARDLPGPRATLFFAPAQIRKRSAEWGPDVLKQRLLMSWLDFAGTVSRPESPWLAIRHHVGPDAVLAAYTDVLGGHGDPRLGHILSLAPALQP